MEWEFTEGDGNDGQFMPTGKVIEFLRQHLAKGEVDAAVELYESCVESVGDQLWGEFENASKPTKKSIANLFFRSRDYSRAARACEMLGEWGAAGRSFAANYDYQKAASCYIKAGDKPRAAKLLEKGGDYRKAAELFYEIKDLDAAAAALEAANDPMGAGQLFARVGDHRRAAHLLTRVPSNHPRYIHAVGLLSESLVKLGRKDLAMQRLGAVLPPGSKVNDKLTAEIGYRLGRLLWEAGELAQARRALELVAAWDPRYRDVERLLPSLSTGVTAPSVPSDMLKTASMRAPQAPRTVPSAPAVAPSVPARPAAPPPASQTDPFAALDSNPFAPKAPVASPPPAQTVPVGYVQRMEGYEVFKGLPIFDELSLDEMKAFFNICEQVFFTKGDILIEQGHPGVGLIIIREGTCQVTKIENGGREVPLATLPAGKYVGEMSLFDDVPTSARVKAMDNVKALRIRKARFEQFLFSHDRIALRIYRTFVRTLSERIRAQNAKA